MDQALPQSETGAKIPPRRTFAIISHPDAGKTTLTEKLLLFGGAIREAGMVKARQDRRNTRSDWMKIERQRGISVTSSVMTFEFGGAVFNLLDTPGHEDFSEDTYRTLTAVDFGGDGDRRGEGHRAADQKAVRGLPPAQHPHHHLHQQDRPRGPERLRAAGRDRRHAGARYLPDGLAGGDGRAVQGLLRYPQRQAGLRPQARRGGGGAKICHPGRPAGATG